ncbi:MAG: response regulator [Dehalococcoidales bacterium]|jgi:CheY-like chemotaxis protein|nr:response regulator [Dehalococcoidales bacterium]
MKNASATRGKVLVVEDEAAVSRLCRVVLKQGGFEVEVAGNGRVAQERLRGGDYELVLLDIKTPVMDGRDFYRFLVKERPELARRVIFTTGDVVDRGIGDFIRLSGRPLLAKPFGSEELKAVVSRTIGGGKD